MRSPPGNAPDIGVDLCSQEFVCRAWVYASSLGFAQRDHVGANPVGELALGFVTRQPTHPHRLADLSPELHVVGDRSCAVARRARKRREAEAGADVALYLTRTTTASARF